MLSTQSFKVIKGLLGLLFPGDFLVHIPKASKDPNRRGTFFVPRAQ